MLSVNDVFDRIRSNTDWTRKVLLGSLLMFIPIVNLLALGYLSRFADSVMKTGDTKLPEWEDWPNLFMTGLGALVVLVIYGALPLLIAWVLSIMLFALTGGLLGWLPFFPITVVALMVPTLTTIGLFVFRMSDGFQTLFLDIRKYFSKIAECWDQLIIPNFAFAGLVILGAPLYGFSVFFAYLIIIPYTAYVFVESEKIND